LVRSTMKMLGPLLCLLQPCFGYPVAGRNLEAFDDYFNRVVGLSVGLGVGLGVPLCCVCCFAAAYIMKQQERQNQQNRSATAPPAVGVPSQPAHAAMMAQPAMPMQMQPAMAMQMQPAMATAVAAPQMSVTCPLSGKPGDVVDLEINGKMHQITIPYGAVPGQPFNVVLAQSQSV